MSNFYIFFLLKLKIEKKRIFVKNLLFFSLSLILLRFKPKCKMNKWQIIEENGSKGREGKQQR